MAKKRKTTLQERVTERRLYDFEFEGETYYLGHPTTEEYDDAMFIQQTALETARSLSVVKDLSDESSSLEVFADKSVEVSSVRAILARDRYLAFTLFCDKEGNRVFNPSLPEDVQRWDQVPVSLKDAARLAVWDMVRDINDIPKDLGSLLKPRSVSVNGSDNGPSKAPQKK